MNLIKFRKLKNKKQFKMEIKWILKTKKEMEIKLKKTILKINKLLN